MVIAILAIGALGTSSAHAAPMFEASSYPASISSESNLETWINEVGKFECNFTYSGTLESSSSTLRLHPQFVTCNNFLFPEASTEGCDFVYTLTEKTAADSYRAQMAVDCEAGKELVLKISNCVAIMVEQSGIETTAFAVSTLGPSVTFTPALDPVTLNVPKDGAFCLFSAAGTTTSEIVDDEPITLNVAGGKTLTITGE